MMEKIQDNEKDLIWIIEWQCSTKRHLRKGSLVQKFKKPNISELIDGLPWTITLDQITSQELN